MLSTLHTRAVAPPTLELLNELLRLPELYDFALVGGTALALYKGHRVSIDLDLFTQMPFDAPALLEQLRASLAPRAVQHVGIARNTLNLMLEGVKTDFLCFDLLQDFSLQELISFFETKFGTDTLHLRKSLTYFDDAENEPDPVSLLSVSWVGVKSRIRAAAAKI